MEGAVEAVQELDDLVSALTMEQMPPNQFSDASEADPVPAPKTDAPTAQDSQSPSSADDVKAEAIKYCGNFTWEHFFTDKCGVLREDALKYEHNLIAHRMSPEDTLGESISLIISVGEIPMGDKLKIIKTIERRERGMERIAQEERKALDALGLGEYNAMEASIILSLGGGTDIDDVDYGIEVWEDGKREMERDAAASRLKNHASVLPSQKKVDLHGMEAFIAKINDPVFRLLISFGYETFDYTKDKELVDFSFAPPSAEA
jgi:hypothetical protein